jgi:ring-1,2-phenylacetyl-CoA epoxidase subunit PaaD
MQLGNREQPTVAQIWSWLAEVQDPEIPVISVVDLGIVRDVAWRGPTGVGGGAGEPSEGPQCVVTITPTYSGCPATEVIAAQIRAALRSHGVGHLRLEVQLSPAWTTDWMTAQGREKLRAYGIAPPPVRAAGARTEHIVGISHLHAWRDSGPAVIACPRCGSANTESISPFGSTPCKALHRCRDCLEPFDYFKCH